MLFSIVFADERIQIRTQMQYLIQRFVPSTQKIKNKIHSLLSSKFVFVIVIVLLLFFWFLLSRKHQNKEIYNTGYC